MGEFASKGIGGAALGTGIAGLSLGVLNSMNGCGGILGNLLGGCNRGYCDSVPATRYDLGLNQELAAKDARIGLLESQVYTDQKLVDVVKDYNAAIAALAAEVRANKDEQTQINTTQAVYNGTMNATVSCIQNQVSQLMGLTKLVVPNASVCPGWGNVTITPAAATTTTTPAA